MGTRGLLATRSPRSRATLVALLVLPAMLLGITAGCAVPSSDGTAGPERTVPASARSADGYDRRYKVVLITVDGLNTNALGKLGQAELPNLHRMIREGASTLNARTEPELSKTLPNHTSMVTGLPIWKRHDGHRVTWNYHRPGTTVQKAAGRWVGSVFRRFRRAGRSTALFASKRKFTLFERSWPKAVRRIVIDRNNGRLTRTAVADLVRHRRAFTMLHLSLPDRAGHASHGMSPRYLRAVRRVDHLVGKVMHAFDTHPRLRQGFTVMLTSDHGFAARQPTHTDRWRIQNYRIPFLVWGGPARAGDLYWMNHHYRNPRRARPGYQFDRQPVRNGDAANLATSLMGLTPVATSSIGKDRTLRVR